MTDMPYSFFDSIPLGLLFFGTLVACGAAMEGGYRYGHWRHRRRSDEKDTPVGAMVASILALFAFMLAFTFGLAGSRFEARRQVILEEANAIGTAYLRAQTLHEPRKTTSLKLLREYTEVRIRGSHVGQTAEAIQRSEEIHGLLWAEAMKEADGHPNPIAALYLASLNQMIDVHTARVQIAIRNRIPVEIWMCLFALAILSMASVGYQAGLSETRRSPAMAVMVLAFAGVFCLIADIERPQEGSLQQCKEVLVQLHDSMKKDAH